MWCVLVDLFPIFQQKLRALGKEQRRHRFGGRGPIPPHNWTQEGILWEIKAGTEMVSHFQKYGMG